MGKCSPKECANPKMSFQLSDADLKQVFEDQSYDASTEATYDSEKENQPPGLGLLKGQTTAMQVQLDKVELEADAIMDDAVSLMDFAMSMRETCKSSRKSIRKTRAELVKLAELPDEVEGEKKIRELFKKAN